ncbi:MAG: hypothetical protein DRQ55_06320 [Planctomycetota bacterium]|nr:MAG: hypothetical protein DRQ55_06320 [Planctomycetota bacterium]
MKPSSVLIAVVLCCVAAARALALPAPGPDEITLARPFARDSGHAFTVAAPPSWVSDAVDGAHSRLVLREDGVPLGPAHASHADVRAQGGGAYSHWDGSLWFSASDNSDPNSNGRVYTVELPRAARELRVLPLRDPFVALSSEALAVAVAGRAVVADRAGPSGGARLNGARLSPAPRAPRLVWWYTIDALRTDTARALLDDGSPLMPALDAFRREAVDFEAAYAQASFTKTSSASMFTGLWPQRHGVMHGVVPVWPEGGTLVFDLDPRFYTLAEFLSDFGYETWTHPFTIHVRPGDGMLQGFDHTDLASGRAAPIAQLPERLFAYEHILGLHGPYAPSDAARARLGSPAPTQIDPASTDWFYRPLDPAQVGELREAYRGEAIDSDAQLQRRLEWLRGSGLWDDALIIVSADHGEEFLEHGATQHSVQLYEELVHVPLLVKFPADDAWAARHGQRVPQRVRLIDLFPTLVEMLAGDEQALPYALDGRSLGPVLTGEESDPFARDVLCRVSFTTQVEGRQDAALYVTDSITAGRLKAHLGWRIRSSQDPAGRPFAQGDELAELYDVAADPGELRDLADRRADALDDLARRLRRAFVPLLPHGVELEQLLSADADDLDPGLLAAMRELGYLR